MMLLYILGYLLIGTLILGLTIRFNGHAKEENRDAYPMVIIAWPLFLILVIFMFIYKLSAGKNA